MQCRSCQYDNPEGMNFCGNCGAQISEICPKCGYKNPGGFKFCGQCGESLAQSEKAPSYAKRSLLDYTPRFLVERVLKARSALVGERKIVSVLFADVEDFTAMSEKLDAEDVHEIMDGCFEILGREIHGAGGTINQYTGDGVMALFGAPIAFDDHIRLACHAALRVQKRLGEYHKKIEDRHHVSFRMRIGIHSGPVVVGAIGDDLRLDYTAQGDTTNLAARLQSLAKPGGIVVSERIRSGAESHFLFHDAGLVNVKGREKPVRVFELLQELPDESLESKTDAGPLPFIGREKDLALLKRSYEDALSDGPKLVAVSGEAGLGKRRLLHTFLHSLQEERPIFLEGHCMPYSQTVALDPLRRMLRSHFQVSEDESLDQAKEKICAQVGIPEVRSRLEVAIGVLQETEKRDDASKTLGEAKKRHLFVAVRDLMIAVAALRPIILAVHNMQWVDATTKELFFFLAGSPATVPILLACLGRDNPEHWVPGMPDHLIRLQPLSEKEATNLFSSVLGSSHLEPGSAREIISNAGGNPLFLVEMAEQLKREDLIVCGPLRCRLTLPAKGLKPPESIHGVLAARLDSLPSAEKEMARLASVIGSEFRVELLRPLLEDDQNLEEILEGLERAGIIQRRMPGDETRYGFKQQMMQEVAYQSLLQSERRKHHRNVAETMESLYRDNLSPHLAALAYHFYEAQDWSKAFGYYLEAGDQAKRAYACQEALSCFERALEIVSRAELADKREISLQLFEWKGGMHYCLGQMEPGRKAFETMHSEAKRSKDREAEAEALFRIGWISFYMHDPARAEEFLRKAIDLSEKEGLDNILLKALSSLGFCYSVLGRPNEAWPLFNRALDLSADLKGAESRAWIVAYLLRHYHWTGEFEKALNLSEELCGLNRELKSPFFNIFLLFNRGLIYGSVGETKEARENLESGLKQLEVGDGTFWRPRFLNTLGWVLAEEGKTQEALKLNEQSLLEAEESGDPETLHNAQINIGEDHLRMGNLSEARGILEKAWAEIRKPGISYARWRYKTRLFIALGELYGRAGDRKKGLDFIGRAMRLAEQSGARKHLARTLSVKAALVKETRPATARRFLEKSLALSKEMGTSLLTDGIHQAMEDIEHESAGRAA